MFNQINWTWFLIGIAFAMFVFPVMSQMLGRLKGQAAMKKAV